jgi:hypothetical protein
MRKIEEKMISAIKARKNFIKDNTMVLFFDERDQIDIYLHNNRIGCIVGKYLYLRDCGYKTKTTKSRLNALLTLLPTLTTLNSLKGKWTVVSSVFDNYSWNKGYWYEFSLETGRVR